MCAFAPVGSDFGNTFPPPGHQSVLRTPCYFVHMDQAWDLGDEMLGACCFPLPLLSSSSVPHLHSTARKCLSAVPTQQQGCLVSLVALDQLAVCLQLGRLPWSYKPEREKADIANVYSLVASLDRLSITAELIDPALGFQGTDCQVGSLERIQCSINSASLLIIERTIKREGQRRCRQQNDTEHHPVLPEKTENAD